MGKSNGAAQAAQFLTGISVLLLAGGLVVAAAFNGSNLTGVRRALWEAGGLMVYAAVVTITLAALFAVLVGVRRFRMRRHDASGSHR